MSGIGKPLASFEKVTNRVVKTLRAFDPYNFENADIHNNWAKSWPSNETPKANRIRRNQDGLSAKDIQLALTDLLKTDVRKEVWIFYGKGFKAGELLKQFKNNHPIYAIRHLAYSIMNCNEAVNRHSASLRIFAQP